HRAEVRAIRHIESLEEHIELHPLSKFELLAEAGVKLVKGLTAQVARCHLLAGICRKTGSQLRRCITLRGKQVGRIAIEHDGVRAALTAAEAKGVILALERRIGPCGGPLHDGSELDAVRSEEHTSELQSRGHL